mmetsp:Transcript_34943/g.99072  ORF Transcript_34943/g.99072 Transcript_34943/m.99072 type:complete len:313 (+) Transcript_34943:42-980(+)
MQLPVRSLSAFFLPGGDSWNRQSPSHSAASGETRKPERIRSRARLPSDAPLPAVEGRLKQVWGQHSPVPPLVVAASALTSCHVLIIVPDAFLSCQRARPVLPPSLCPTKEGAETSFHPQVSLSVRPVPCNPAQELRVPLTVAVVSRPRLCAPAAGRVATPSLLAILNAADPPVAMASEAQQEPAAAPLLPPPQAALPFANDGSFMEQFLKMQQQQQEKCSSSTAPVRDSNFIASSSFTGAKEGFVFKSGTKGVGYYKDAPKPLDSNQSASAKKQAAKPVILKSKPIIAVQKRSGSGVDLSANKKKKTGTGAQ